MGATFSIVLSVIGAVLVIAVIIAVICCCRRSPGQRGQVNQLGNAPEMIGPNVQVIAMPPYHTSIPPTYYPQTAVYSGGTNQQTTNVHGTSPSLNGHTHIAHAQLKTTESPPNYESLSFQSNNTSNTTHVPQPSSTTEHEDNTYQPLAHRENRTDTDYTQIPSSINTYLTLTNDGGHLQNNDNNNRDNYEVTETSTGSYLTMTQADSQAEGSEHPARDSYLVPQPSGGSYLTMPTANEQVQNSIAPANDSYLVPRPSSDSQYESINDYRYSCS
ncbi:uncharacterized protein LOC128206071 [Mya arenaria]|uniref:uncharacterized protein LOC128206071 n=1 Tax=Mya arenaria TaxID=6604 RepID=UPI0022E90D79|nr:uncharacterized protein LOC128206071 [Mya arenaria]